MFIDRGAPEGIRTSDLAFEAKISTSRFFERVSDKGRGWHTLSAISDAMSGHES
jgi:hypothetical protein